MGRCWRLVSLCIRKMRGGEGKGDGDIVLVVMFGRECSIMPTGSFLVMSDTDSRCIMIETRAVVTNKHSSCYFAENILPHSRHAINNQKTSTSRFRPYFPEHFGMLLHARINPSILLDGLLHDATFCRLFVTYRFHLQLHLQFVSRKCARKEGREELER